MMFDIDGALVIHEGTRRLRWAHLRAAAAPVAGGPHAPPVRRLVDWVWPDPTTQAQIRRQIEHGRRVVVVFDDTDPVVTVPAECVPTVPSGAVAREGPDRGTVSLSIPPFTWLSPTDRARGEAFSANAQSNTGGIPHSARPPLLVEGALVGTEEPLRFVFQTRSMTIDVIRQVVRHLYSARIPTSMFPPVAEHNPVPLAWLIRAQAA